ncbi:MAG: hypothetical protein AB7V22_08400 [Kiritimatiellia bacterium]
MNATWLDWVAVGVAVAAAALWLALRIRRNWKAQRDNANRSCACLTGCDGCPFAGKSFDAGKKP